MIAKEIRRRLLTQQDTAYRDFQARLMPGIPPERILGVRTPILRAMAKELSVAPDIDDFLRILPHDYYEENNLHGFLIARCRDYRRAVAYTDAFLPYVDNWATCDSFSPTVFRRHRGELKAEIERWIRSVQTYTVRFGIEMVMTHYLDEDFDPALMALVASVRSDEYYVNMMIAWYFATALAKQWDSAFAYFAGRRLPEWVHRKAIQKAVESYRITPEQKELLRTLR